MNTSLAQEPFTRLEFAGGSIAVAAVVLIALLGLALSKPQDLPPPAPSTSAPSVSSTNSSISAGKWHRAPRSEPPAIDGADRAVAAQPPETRGSITPSAPLEVSPTEQAPPARESWQTREAAIPSSSGAERNLAERNLADRNLDDRSDALFVQTRLHELGYYSGHGNGVWGAASRNALRDFKSMNGLQEDDKWDKETEQRLLSRPGIPATSTFIGGWALDASSCPGRADAGATRTSQGLWSVFSFVRDGMLSRQSQSTRDGNASLVRISSRGAETAGAKCDFHSVRRATPGRWHIQAVCSADGQSWSAHVSLTLNGRNLTWSSERGTIKYVRCS